MKIDYPLKRGCKLAVLLGFILILHHSRKNVPTQTHES